MGFLSKLKAVGNLAKNVGLIALENPQLFGLKSPKVVGTIQTVKTIKDIYVSAQQRTKEKEKEQ